MFIVHRQMLELRVWAATNTKYGTHTVQSGSALPWGIATKDQEYTGALQFRYNGGNPGMIFSRTGGLAIGDSTYVGAAPPAGSNNTRQRRHRDDESKCYFAGLW